MANLLEIKNLNLFFRGEDENYQALYDINLCFEKGKIHSIVGESGCGKSTLAKAIMRLVPFYEGNILYNNEDIMKYSKDELRNYRHNVQMIFQNPYSSFNPTFSIISTISLSFSSFE